MRRVSLTLGLLLLALVGVGMPLRAQQGPVFDCTPFDSWEWSQSAAEREYGPAAATSPAGMCPHLPLGAAPALWIDTLPANVEQATLVTVVEGDVVDVRLQSRQADAGITRVRLLLVDAPGVRTAAETIPCFARQATYFLTWLLGLADGGLIYLESDTTDRDGAGRSLRYLWLRIGERSTWPMKR